LWVRPGAYHRVEHPKGASPANIRVGWKGLPGTNTVTYFIIMLIVQLKIFSVDPSSYVMKYVDV
jgi:hypothetical protein